MGVKAALKVKTQDSSYLNQRKTKKTPKVTNKKLRDVTSAYLPQKVIEEYILGYREKARKLARSILRKWRAHLELDELDSVVDLSLCEAGSRFNPKLGASFMTFLFYHLRGNLIRTISIAANANSVPLYDSDGLDSIGEARDHSRGYRLIHASEIAEAVTCKDSLLPDEMIAQKQLIVLSQKAYFALDSLEKEIIDRIYNREEQLLDVANSLGYSRCHISRVKRKALENMYEELKRLTNGEDLGIKPSYDDEEDFRVRRPIKRIITRRRPKGKLERAGAVL